MAITLADAQKNADSDLDYEVIDEFRKSDWFLDQVTFDDAAVPGAGGGTLTYAYTRLTQERGASVRQFNAESMKGQAKRDRFSVDLVPFSGAYDIDRTLAKLGPRATSELALQSQQAIKAVRAKFNEALIDGAQGGDGTTVLTFDGLDAALAGSTTETFGSADPANNEFVDWSSISGEDAAHNAIDELETLLGLIDGDVTALLGNRRTIAKVKGIARRAGYYERTKDEFGRVVESFAGIPFVDLGARSGSSNPVIPVESRDVDGDGGATAAVSNLTDLYAVRLGLDALHGVSAAGGGLLQSWLPDFSTSGAVKTGEVELGPAAVALKRTKSAAVLRNIKV